MKMNKFKGVKMNIKIKRENNLLLITSPYSRSFVSKMRNLQGKWNRELNVWEVSEEFEDKVNEAILEIYRVDLTGKEEYMIVEYCAKDFEDRDKDDIRIGNIVTVYRPSRDAKVILRDTAIMEGEFDKSGGSVKYPAVFDRGEGYNVILRSTIFKKEYDKLSEDEKSKLTIIRRQDKKERLLNEKEIILKRLSEIEDELKKCEENKDE
ncbi:MAG: hypothetical protein HXL94_00430 [[Eubacterium] sulci]|jgi:hypothetical protein|nr:hypothetical protein [[Eubacterium] sulci]